MSLILRMVHPPPTDVFFPADSVSSSLQRDDHRVRVVVCVADLQVFKEVSGLPSGPTLDVIPTCFPL